MPDSAKDLLIKGAQVLNYEYHCDLMLENIKYLCTQCERMQELGHPPSECIKLHLRKEAAK